MISALSTLAYEGRRGEFFEGQLVAALKILQNGDTTPARMTGSWAGAMGHTQFIPTSYLAYAVDFRGDGRRDIWDNDPTDALASTADYFNVGLDAWPALGGGGAAARRVQHRPDRARHDAQPGGLGRAGRARHERAARCRITGRRRS